MELGLALYIVSKRGRQVIFGQTGLLFANRQWGSYTGKNRYIAYPIAFPKMNQLVAIATSCALDIDTCDLTWFAFHIRQPGEANIDTLISTTVHWISVGY